MKDRLLIILTAVAVLFMVGCENSLERSIAFDVTPQVESGSVTGSTISVPAGTPVTFNFTNFRFFNRKISWKNRTRQSHDYFVARFMILCSAHDLFDLPAANIDLAK